jgi:2-C-methyl-D-erythritol 2,4-cyclodiphosphate synthase
MLQRFGFGYDSHTFGASRPLILGGITIEHECGLQGHSDADAVAHALIDALLGATALGDIGQLFPDTDEQWKDASSIDMLVEVRRRIQEANCRIVNVDVTVVAEVPKLAPYVKLMRENLSSALKIPVSAVSIKAKTNEKMDAIGQGKGLAVYAVASVGEV